MDIHDTNPPREDRTPEADKPHEGKRPQGNHHHNRNRNRRGDRDRNRNQTQAEVTAAPEAATPEAAAPARSNPDREGSKKPNNPPKGGTSRPADKRSDNRGNRDNRENRDNRDNRDAKKPENREPSAPKTAESGERRQPPATGRPQRNIRRAPVQADLPDMEHLLIDDAMNPPAAPVLGSDDAPDAAEVERILERDIFARPTEPIPETLPEGKLVIAGIRFRTGGKTYFFDPGSLTCKAGQYAIVETARGLEFGEVCIGNRMVDESMVVPPLRPVIRIATESDIKHNKENHAREDAAFKVGVEKIREHKLDMKLVSVQYTFDNSKLLFYFTSAGRVDFRELVKDLAGVFHIRIELRQIGIRDEARMIGGLGACGRPLCCTTFLSDFGQVSMKMAKEQNLSLNSTKISGCCGRLMCCLRYEHETYTEEIKKTPAQGTFVNTPDGPGIVTEIFPLQGEVKVSLKGQQDQAPKRYKRELVEVQVRAPRPERPAEDAAESVSEPESAEEN